MDRYDNLMLRRLVDQWDQVVGTLESVPGATVSEKDGWATIRSVASRFAETARFELQPVVFNVPERANHSEQGLYVVADGWLELRRDSFQDEESLVTHAFSTRAAYFRKKVNQLEHVYGAHYDVDPDKLGHPIFHSQLRDFSEFYTLVLDRFKFQADIVNKFGGVLQNVRTPTAQMDFFSFILQLFADHLLGKESGAEDKDAFKALLKRDEFLRGAGARSARLTAEIARGCYRSLHWYPLV